jgi:hypothetical protein
MLSQVFNEPRKLAVMGALCLGGALAAQLFAAAKDAPVPFTCSGMNGQALVEKNDPGYALQIFNNAGKRTHYAHGFFSRSELAIRAQDFCDGKRADLALDETLNDPKLYTCMGPRGETGSVELTAETSVVVTRGTSEQTVTQGDLGQLRYVVSRFCATGIRL